MSKKRFVNPVAIHYWFTVAGGSTIYAEASQVRTESRQRDEQSPYQRVYVIETPKKLAEKTTVLWPEQLTKVEVMVETA